ncbi:helix-turn-helix domain-containing protein [Pseudomonas aeruginosa]|uniref:helix-turn-helix domain-containing protein n=1 Tax=Pseudomonas aeruginosa TaxID=287 RepID=UPI0028696696|nr:helix-turn-helix domain-containing protein [Pseudomonas aeruginosa]
MSTIIMSACWPLQGLTPAQKAVLISLADNANDEGVCWPSVAKIAERTCLSERAVQQAIKVLNECKALRRLQRWPRISSASTTPT